MKKCFDNFFEHINPLSVDQYQTGYDEMAVCGPLTNDMEVLSLHNIVQNHIPFGHIIEIGSWLGLSTITLALSLREKYSDCYVFSIDPHDKKHSLESDATSEYFSKAPEDFDMSKIYKDNLKKWSVKRNVVYLRSFSQEIDIINFLRPISMVFIDGDHSRKAVTADLERFVPLVRDGGFVVLHDKNDRVVQDGVTDFLNQEKDYELVDMIPELLETDFSCDQRGYKEMLYIYKKIVNE